MNAAKRDNQLSVTGKHIVFLGLGSNISPEHYLLEAIARLRNHIKLEEISTAWETPAVGDEGPDYLNLVIRGRTDLSPQELKEKVIRKIEFELGRVRTQDKNAPRTIDIDTLIYDGRILDNLIWTRVFWAVPLAELLSDLRRENSDETIAQVAEQLKNQTRIKARPDIVPWLKVLPNRS